MTCVEPPKQKKQANCLPGGSKGYLKELEASRVGGSGTQKSGCFRNVLAGGVQELCLK